MGALTYYFFKKTKNQLVLFFRSPAKIIYAVLLIFLMATSFSARNLPSYVEQRDISELYAIVWALYTFIFITVSKNGFNNGSALFSMADVNLVFTSPVKNTASLIFAMMQQLGRSLFVGVFLVLQFNTVNNYYGVNFGEFLLMVAFYGLTVFFAHMLSVMIYTFCCAGDKSTMLVKAVYYGIIGFFAVLGVSGSFSSGGFTLQSAVECISEDVFKLFPVSGFFAMILEGLILADMGRILLGSGLLLAFTVCFVFVVFIKKFDFYEDVITSAEINSNMGGVNNDVTDTRVVKKVKTGKIGLVKGFGATAIYEKNKIENRREKLFYIDSATVVYSVVCGITAFVSDSLWTVFIMIVYLTMFGISLGRWARELKLHYIYLIPEKSSKKLFNMLKEQLPLYVVQSAFIMLPLLFILRLSIIEYLSMVFGRFSFCLLFTGVTLLMKNIFSTTDKSTLYAVVYMFFSFITAVPSIIAAVVMSSIFVFNIEIAFFSMLIVNTFVAALLVVANKNLLEN